MQFFAEADVITYMKKKGRTNLAVEVAQTNHSDIEVTELYTRLVKDDFADYLVRKKNYRRFPLYEKGGQESGLSCLLPKYYMEVKDEVVFSLKKILFFHKIEIDGISL